MPFRVVLILSDEAFRQKRVKRVQPLPLRGRGDDSGFAAGAATGAFWRVCARSAKEGSGLSRASQMPRATSCAGRTICCRHPIVPV